MKFMNRLLAVSLAIFSFLNLANAQADKLKPLPGKFYAELPVQAQRIATDPNKIEVIEVFAYTCGHCFHLEPIINKWAETKPANVEYIQLAMPGERAWGLYAQVFYTLEVMGETKKMNNVVFDMLHVKGMNLIEKDTIAKYLGENGISQDAFLKNWDSFAVKSKMNRAQEIISKQYQLNFTPAVIVNGKYLISGELAGKKNPAKKVFENMIDVLNELIADLSKNNAK